MKVIYLMLGTMVAVVGSVSLTAQSPVLSSIEAPYANLSSQATIAGHIWAADTVAYGPVGTPLILSGSNFGSSGTVTFTPYKNGAVDPNVSPVNATVTSWTPGMLTLNVPAGAYSGAVTATSSSGTSNPLPFIVTPGNYSASCPVQPSPSQLQIVTSSLTNGLTGQAYSDALTATGGTQPYAWLIDAGSLPAGLLLNTATGVISGTPTVGFGPTFITFLVADNSSPRQMNTATFPLTVIVTPTVVSLNPSSGYVGLAVIISGSGFGATEGQSVVTFNGSHAGVLNWSDSSITAVVPSNATSGPVVVTLANGLTSNTNVAFTLNSSSCN